MYEVLDEKLNQFKSQHITNAELKKWLKDSDLWYWVYSMLRIEGQNISGEQIMSILDGELDENLSLDVYRFVLSYAALYKDMQISLQMQLYPDIKLVSRWYSILFNADEALPFRQDNPVLYQFNYVPCHFREVGENLHKIFKENAGSIKAVHYLDRTVRLFMEFLRIYPLEKDNLTMAGTILFYMLLQAGLPIPDLNVGEQDFATLVSKYMNNKDSGAFTRTLEAALISRLDQVNLLCRQAQQADKSDDGK